MTRNASPLLPEGLRDRLPPEAEAASRVTRALLDALKGHGYERVAPPLAEFRETLDDGAADAGKGRDLLRFTDPVSQRTLAIRPDITTQVGRIATSRMAHAARPLRLSYAGQVVKLKAGQLRPEREMLQIGAELIGTDSVAAAREIVRVALSALKSAAVTGISIDFTLPDLVETLAESALPLAHEDVARIRDELDAKDAGALSAAGGDAYLPLIAAAGPFAQAIARLRDIDGGTALTSRIDALEAIAGDLGDDVQLTLDPTERHGFEYQSWFGFSLFVEGYRGTIGRGGSYLVTHQDGRQEPAIGFSLYPDPLIDEGLGQDDSDKRRLFLPQGHHAGLAADYRTQGWVTIAALSDSDDAHALGCTHQLGPNGPELLG